MIDSLHALPQISTVEMPEGFVFAVCCVMGARLMLNLRETFYNGTVQGIPMMMGSTECSMPTLEFKVNVRV